ncbi:MAG: LamG-like jellyroll fold domain-containing protein [Planctomycetota bacterium]
MKRHATSKSLALLTLFLILLLSSRADACASIPAGLVSWWRGTGNVNDALGGNHGTLEEGTSLVSPGFVGEAFSFDGVDDYVNIPDAPSLDIFFDFTVEAWVMPTQAKQHRVITKWGSNGFRTFSVEIEADGALAFHTSGDGSTISTVRTAPGAVPVGLWTHIACVHRGNLFGQKLVYINGTSVPLTQVGAAPILLFVSPSPVRLGRNFNEPIGSFSFQGLLDEVSIYNQALSTSAISFIEFNGIFGKCPPCVVADFSASTLAGFAPLPVTFTDFSTAGPSAMYAWDFDGDGITDSTNPNPSFTYMAPGTYDVSLEVTDTCGLSRASATIQVTDPTPVVSCTVDPLAGTVTVDWSASSVAFNSVEVLIDGLSAGLFTGVTDATVPLGPPGVHEVCVAGATGTSTDTGCCSVDYAWNIASGVLPDETCMPWTVFLSGGSTAQTTATHMALSTTTTGDDAEIRQAVTAPDTWVIEARMQLISGSSATANRAPASIVFNAGPLTGNMLNIDHDEIFLLSDCSTAAPAAIVDTNDAFHTYRIEVRGNTIEVYYDNGPTPVLTSTTFTEASPDCFFGSPFLRIGDTAGAAQGESHWEYLAHNGGQPYLPTNPATASSLACVVGSGCVITATWINDSRVSDVVITLDGAEVYNGPAIESFDTAPVALGSHELCIVGVSECGPLSDPVCCTVDVLAPAAATNLACQVVSGCIIDATWTNDADIADISIAIDGMDVYNGPAIDSFVSAALPLGSHELCVVGTNSCGNDTTSACCTVDIVAPAAATGINCQVVSGCTIDATWTNDPSIADVSITIDGMEVYSGPAIDNFMSASLASGSHELCVVGTDACGNDTSPTCCNVTCGTFTRGDCNADATFNIADPVRALTFLFPSMPPATPVDCEDACDCNDDEVLNIADPVCMLNALFGMVATPPPAPFPACGADPAGSALGCNSFPPCP